MAYRRWTPNEGAYVPDACVGASGLHTRAEKADGRRSVECAAGRQSRECAATGTDRNAAFRRAERRRPTRRGNAACSIRAERMGGFRRQAALSMVQLRRLSCERLGRHGTAADGRQMDLRQRSHQSASEYCRWAAQRNAGIRRENSRLADLAARRLCPLNERPAAEGRAPNTQRPYVRAAFRAGDEAREA